MKHNLPQLGTDKSETLIDEMKPADMMYNNRDNLELHMKAVMARIREDCNYKALSRVANQNEIDAKRRIIFKYFWVLEYHNRACELYNINEYRVKFKVSIDFRFHQPYIETES